MFTGIIELAGTVLSVTENGANKTFTISCSFAHELKEGESISHNGACLTVEKCGAEEFTVTAISETLIKTNLSTLRKGSIINLERAMRMNARIDGHLVLGHVDETLICEGSGEQKGSKVFYFTLNKENAGLLVSKGSVCIDGVSLTVATLEKERFSVAVIPYTLEHTSFRQLQKGMRVNVEYDLLGKYVQSQLQIKE
jgi:riboflavin synthase